MTPQPAPGTQVVAFASGLNHPRWLYVLPNGDVLVAESNAPPKPEDGKGIKGWLMGLVMKWAGAGVPSANRITLLRDSDADGVTDVRSVLLDGSELAFWYGAGRQRSLHRQFRRDSTFPLRRGRHAHQRARQTKSWIYLLVRSTITGPKI
jgi:glucose/arabinose dehydrogenase